MTHYTHEQVQFISECIESGIEPVIICKLYKQRFHVQRSNDAIKSKIRSMTNTAKNVSEPICNSEPIYEKPTPAYSGVRKFTNEQIDLLASDISDFEKMNTFFEIYPMTNKPSIRTFNIWLNAAKSKKRNAIEKQRKEDELRLAESKKQNEQPILIPARIVHKQDVNKPKTFADEGELLTKIFNSNMQIERVLLDILSEQRKHTAILDKMLIEFTNAKELNQKRLSITETKTSALQ